MKIECIENPGSRMTTAVRECEPNRHIPFGVVHVPEDKDWRVYHIPTGQWVHRGTETTCNLFLHNLEGVSSDQRVDWDFSKSKELQEIHRSLLQSARNFTKMQK